MALLYMIEMFISKKEQWDYTVKHASVLRLLMHKMQYSQIN